MPAYNVRAAVLPKQPQVLSLAALPDSKALGDAATKLSAAFTRLDLVYLDRSERQTCGGSATVDEMRVNALYAGVCSEFPEVMQVLRQPPTYFNDLYQLDLCLAQIETATTLHVQAGRAANVLLAGGLTAMLDRVQIAADRRTSDDASDVPASERMRLLTRMTLLSEPTESARERDARKAQRRSRLAQELTNKVNAASAAAQAAHDQATLRGDLPAGSAAAKAAAKALPQKGQKNSNRR